MGEPREPEAPESGGEKVESRNSQRREYRHGFLAVDLPSYLLPSTRSTFYFLLSTFYFLLSTFYFLLSTFYFLLSTFYLLSRLFWLLSRSDFIRYGSGVSSESQVLPMRPCHLPEIK